MFFSEDTEKFKHIEKLQSDLLHDIRHLTNMCIDIKNTLVDIQNDRRLEKVEKSLEYPNRKFPS